LLLKLSFEYLNSLGICRRLNRKRSRAEGRGKQAFLHANTTVSLVECSSSHAAY
jgi:hypothetical protein